ncbi:Y-family DNA polymerase [Microbacterium resistens]
MNAASPARVLVLWFPDWPLRAALGAPPHPSAAILRAGAVLACTAPARAQGVRAGQRRREAQGLDPALRLIPADPERDERAFLPVLRAIEEQAPGVQMLRPGIAVLRSRGVARYHGGEEAAASALSAALATKGFGEVRIGIADGPFTAEHAARRAPSPPGHLLVPPGASAAFLAPLSARVLPDPDLVMLLGRLGVRTLGDFAALGPLDVRDRFGEHGARLHALARGADSRPVVSRAPDPELAAETEFETPLTQSDQIAFAIRRTADEVILALAEASLVSTEVRIDLTDDDDGVHSRTWLHPTCFEAPDLVDRVRWQLEALTGDAPPGTAEDTRLFRGIARVRITPIAVDDAAHHQPGLFGSGTDERLHHAVSRVQTLLGHDGVLTAAVAGGRRLADRQQLTPWGERVVLARDPDQPWPGTLPDPLPAEVFVPLRPITVADTTGAAIRVDERGNLSAAPARIEADAVRSWAGPWPVRDRRGQPDGVRGERFQLVDEHERAWLVLHTDDGWWAEGRYH